MWTWCVRELAVALAALRSGALKRLRRADAGAGEWREWTAGAAHVETRASAMTMSTAEVEEGVSGAFEQGSEPGENRPRAQRAAGAGSSA